MNIYLDLYLTFAKIGVCTFGGGYAMLPILQRDIVSKKQWATNDELADYYAVGQCTPGIIAVNTATFIGHRLRGNLGGVLATLGLISPGLVIISVIAACLENFADLPIVNHAFGGIRACVVALILSSVIKLAKKPLKKRMAQGIFLVVLLLSLSGTFVEQLPALLETISSPVALVVMAGVWGLCYGAWQRRAEPK